jgi:hypothetical protein
MDKEQKKRFDRIMEQRRIVKKQALDSLSTREGRLRILDELARAQHLKNNPDEPSE